MKQACCNRLLHPFNAHPQPGKRMVGLGAKALWELWQRTAEAERAKRLRQAQRPRGKRQAGGGRKQDAAVLGRLLVTLIYLRQHWTLQAIALTLDCAEATVWNYIHEMLPHLRERLPASLLEQWQQECPSIERAELEQWLAELPEGALLVDSWEQAIPRPTDDQE
ncbi:MULTISPECIES: transposase family protein [Trichocoleus]|uniref:Transposase family protein n=1 Tax=Trichocoleus desertorum GB2-A4 TaxID=2933944 RepID=A0ABV0JG20_9CYAN|nr:transposase family protein [Trichocoleus sp. FACHB-46]MBD1864803.1 transposase family protein [Trichocoleus sp. FACHB-46]